MAQWSVGESIEIRLEDDRATRVLGMALGQILSRGSILLLEGDLGSGKTTLVQGLGQSLGITEPIVSPTFTLVSEYPEGRIPLYHFDLYRLDPPEIDALHLETYWDGLEYPPGIVAIEWAERLMHRPTDFLLIRLTIAEEERDAKISSTGEASTEILEKLKAIVPALEHL